MDELKKRGQAEKRFNIITDVENKIHTDRKIVNKKLKMHQISSIRSWFPSCIFSKEISRAVPNR